MGDFIAIDPGAPPRPRLPALLTVAEAAKHLRLHEQEVLREVASMRLQAIRDRAGALCFRRADVERLDSERVTKKKAEQRGNGPWLSGNLS